MRNFARFCLRITLYPFVIAFANAYKWYQRKFRKREIKLKYNDIVDGFSYMIATDPKVEEVAKYRAGVCSKCPHSKYIAGGKLMTIMVNEKAHQYKAMKCDQCGCALAAKVRAMNDQCPVGLWRSEEDIQS